MFLFLLCKLTEKTLQMRSPVKPIDDDSITCVQAKAVRSMFQREIPSTQTEYFLWSKLECNSIYSE